MSGVVISVSANFATGRGYRRALVGGHGSQQALLEMLDILGRRYARAIVRLLVPHFHAVVRWKIQIVAYLRFELRALGRRARRVC